MSIELIPNVVDGKAVHVANRERSPAFNPSLGELIAETPLCGLGELEVTVQSAERAYREWSNVPVTSASLSLAEASRSMTGFSHQYQLQRGRSSYMETKYQRYLNAVGKMLPVWNTIKTS
jgi:hypothetical protein